MFRQEMFPLFQKGYNMTTLLIFLHTLPPRQLEIGLKKLTW